MPIREFLLLVIFITFASSSLKYEKILHKKLLNDYNLDVRPEPAHDQPVVVDFDLVLQGLTSLDVKSQILEINAYATMQWVDPQLRWNASEMDGIQSTMLGSQYIWTPDIVLYNNADDKKYFHYEIYKTKARVKTNGSIFWTAPVTWKVSCSCDVSWFPFDEQICTMTYGSWSYTAPDMKVQFYSGAGTQQHFLGGDFLVNNGEWKIKEVTTSVKNVTYHCCPDPFSTISFELHLSRMSLYYVLYIILPLVSLLLLFVLIFHIDEGDRMGFGVTILLSITVYLLVMSEKLPEKSDKIPVLGVCFIVEFFYLCVGLVLAAYLVRLSKRTNSRPPQYLRRISNSCKRLFESAKESNMQQRIVLNDILDTVEDEGQGEDIKSHLTDSNKNQQSENKRNLSEWASVTRTLEWFFTVFYLIMMFFTPFIIILALGTKGMAK